MSRLPRSAAGFVDRAMDRTVAPGYSRIGYAVRRRLPTWPDDPAPGTMAGRAALVTGASSGLGIATAAGLAALGADVHLLVRNIEKGERVRRDLGAAYPATTFTLWRCDVSDLDDVRRFVADLSAEVEALDVVVHNAGAMPPTRQESAQGHEMAMAVHLLGPVAMTEGLRPLLARSAGAGRSARTILVTSGGMYGQRLPSDDPEYLESDYRPAGSYARSKRAQVALLPRLAARWAADGIGVHAVHPGWADTPGVADSLPRFHKLTGPLLRDAEEGADSTIWLAAVEPEPPTGLLWQDRRSRPTHLAPWTRESAEARETMWQWMSRATGLTA